jgi:hypothetical protein
MITPLALATHLLAQGILLYKCTGFSTAEDGRGKKNSSVRIEPHPSMDIYGYCPVILARPLAERD